MFDFIENILEKVLLIRPVVVVVVMVDVVSSMN